MARQTLAFCIWLNAHIVQARLGDPSSQGALSPTAPTSRRLSPKDIMDPFEAMGKGVVPPKAVVKAKTDDPIQSWLSRWEVIPSLVDVWSERSHSHPRPRTNSPMNIKVPSKAMEKQERPEAAGNVATDNLNQLVGGRQLMGATLHGRWDSIPPLDERSDSQPPKLLSQQFTFDCTDLQATTKGHWFFKDVLVSGTGTLKNIGKDRSMESLRMRDAVIVIVAKKPDELEGATITVQWPQDEYHDPERYFSERDDVVREEIAKVWSSHFKKECSCRVDFHGVPAI